MDRGAGEKSNNCERETRLDARRCCAYTRSVLGRRTSRYLQASTGHEWLSNACVPILRCALEQALRYLQTICWAATARTYRPNNLKSARATFRLRTARTTRTTRRSCEDSSLRASMIRSRSVVCFGVVWEQYVDQTQTPKMLRKVGVCSRALKLCPLAGSSMTLLTLTPGGCRSEGKARRFERLEAFRRSSQELVQRYPGPYPVQRDVGSVGYGGRE
jgi:hypothetical protein